MGYLIKSEVLEALKDDMGGIKAERGKNEQTTGKEMV